jgi:HAD superfamily hydrolase (TIGR01509 family)
MGTILDCTALLFDMDGTLVDSTAVVERHWARWAERRGVSLGAIMAVSHGRPTLETLRIVAPELATKEEAARLENEEAEDTDGLRAVEGASDLLGALPDGSWAVVTSASRWMAVIRLSAAGLRVPEVLVTSEDVPRGKPDPAPYLEGARRLSTNAPRTVVLEDAPVGIASGRAAGATVIGVTTTYPRLEDCHLCIADLRAVRIVEAAAGRIRVSLNGL